MLCLIFDMDDCLFMRVTPFAKACEDVFSSRFRLDWNALYKVRCYYSDLVLEDSQTGKMSLEDSHYYRLSEALKTFGYTTTKEEVARFEERYNAHQADIHLEKPFDTLFPLLKEKGIRMGVMTNGPSEHQRNKMQALGLERYIEPCFWVVSGDRGIIKPYIEIYHEVEEKVGCNPQDIYMIGDTYATDIMGAIHANWHTIWYNHRHDEMGEEKPEYIAYNAAMLEQVILELLKKDS